MEVWLLCARTSKHKLAANNVLQKEGVPSLARGKLPRNETGMTAVGGKKLEVFIVDSGVRNTDPRELFSSFCDVFLWLRVDLSARIWGRDSVLLEVPTIDRSNNSGQGETQAMGKMRKGDKFATELKMKKNNL